MKTNSAKVKIIRKPIKPEKFIIEQQSADYDFNWISNKVSWESFKDWARNTVPVEATDVSLELIEETRYDNCNPAIRLSWNIAISNPEYGKEMKKYKKKMTKWKSS